MTIRPYTSLDYIYIRKLYEESGWFDELVDSENKLNEQTSKDPDSILVATNNNEIIGSVSLLATGCLALFFRLIAPNEEVKKLLLAKGEEFFRVKGYKRIDIIAPEEDLSRQKEYADYGFNKGNLYRWFWKV